MDSVDSGLSRECDVTKPVPWQHVSHTAVVQPTGEGEDGRTLELPLQNGELETTITQVGNVGKSESTEYQGDGGHGTKLESVFLLQR